MKQMRNVFLSIFIGFIVSQQVFATDQLQDIDLFAGTSATNTNVPTVLIGWHSQANITSNVGAHGCTYTDLDSDGDGDEDGGVPSLGATTVGGMEQCAIVNTLLALVGSPLEDAVKVGVMVFNNKNDFDDYDNGARTAGGDLLGNGDGKCGFLLSNPELLDSDGIRNIVNRVKNIPAPNGGSALSDLVAESWAMLNGLSNSCSGVDYSTLAGVDSASCSNSVLVYLGNIIKINSSVADDQGGTGGVPDEILKSQLTSAFGYSVNSTEYKNFATPRAVTELGGADKANNNFWGDEWARFMNAVDVGDSAQEDRNVTTYTIAVYDPDLVSATANSNLRGEFNFLADMAYQGGGKALKVSYTDGDPASELAKYLSQILYEVQDVTSVFSSATLPVSANTQGTYLNQVYIAMFRPDSSALPRWNGNVKQYHLGFDTGGNLVLTDSTQNPATGTVTSVTNPVTGAIASTAESFWTTNTPTTSDGSTLVSDWPVSNPLASPPTTGFWVNSPEGDAFDGDMPDGDLVEKGGAGQMLRVDYLTSSANREIFTCTSSGACPTNAAMPAFTYSAGDTLATNLTTAIGAAASGSSNSASIDVGRRDTDEEIHIASCSGSGQSKTCVITHDGSGGTALDASTDKVIIEGAWNDVLASNKQTCTYSTPCAISNVTNTSFTITAPNLPPKSGNTEYTDFTGATIVEVSKVLKVAQVGHGFTVGGPESPSLEGCVVSNPDGEATYNTNLLTGNVSGTVISVPDEDHFVMRIDTGFVLAETSPSDRSTNVSVTCGSSVNTLTAENLINWMRGDDIAGNETKQGPCPLNSRDATCPISVRGSIHGDVLHSRPAVINYGGSTGVIVYYGSNDGHFRAINGNQESTTAPYGFITDPDAPTKIVRPGGELWSFVAPEFFEKLPRLYSNSPRVAYPNITGEPTPTERDYFFDGTTTILQDNRVGFETSGESYIFLSARRGGRLLYALNVTDPFAPRFLWKFDSSDMQELGQTWSQPKVTILKNYPRPVLVFGAGYDVLEDANPFVGPDTMGRGIVILDAVSGDVLWAAANSCASVSASAADDGTSRIGGACETESGFTRAFAADITLVDSTGDGFTDRLYAADIGGNIWRVDIDIDYGNDATMADSVSYYKLASLGSSSADNNARKFLFPPDFVSITAENGETYQAVTAVSGDREKPLFDANVVDVDTEDGRADAVQNRFYVVFDDNSGTTITESNLLPMTEQQCLNPDAAAPTSPSDFDECDDTYTEEIYFDGNVAGIDGYYIDLGDREKGVNAPLAIAGKVYFGTNTPDTSAADSCTSNLGRARAWVVDLFFGTYQVNEFSGGGLPPSPIAGLVTIGDKTVPFIIGGSGPSPFDPTQPSLPLSEKRNRFYWYFEKD